MKNYFYLMALALMTLSLQGFNQKDLEKARLLGACPNCDLKKAPLAGLNCRGSFKGADLTGAILDFANCPKADFTGAKLKGAQGVSARFDGADFTDAATEGFRVHFARCGNIKGEFAGVVGQCQKKPLPGEKQAPAKATSGPKK